MIFNWIYSAVQTNFGLELEEMPRYVNAKTPFSIKLRVTDKDTGEAISSRMIQVSARNLWFYTYIYTL